MKKLLTLAIASLMLAGCAGNNGKVAPAIPKDAAIEKQIGDILSKMSLDEKVGQMCQIDFSVFMNSNGTINYSKLDEAIKVYKIGSLLNTPRGYAETPEEYSDIISYVQKTAADAGVIPIIYGLDQNHGASYTAGATLFPQEIALAATFNREHASAMGEVAAYETRASMVPWTFNPTMDLASNQAWSRIWESFGEDVYVNAEMGKALNKGYQGEDPNHIDLFHMASCIKHYMAYGAAVSSQDRTPSSVTPWDMRGRYFEPFKECIRDGALSIMVNSTSNNGFPFHANAELLTKWAKDEMYWDGMIITDFNDINNLYTREFIAKDKKDAIRIAINAGIDMAMEPYSTDFCTLLKELVQEKKVPMSRIDDAVLRILRLKARIGLLDNPTWDTKSYYNFASKEFAHKALATALESEILLKNNGILPLKAGQKILVTGPNANSMRTLNGGWSYSWQGNLADEPRFTEQYNTILEAVQNRFGKGNVAYYEGVRYTNDPALGMASWQSDAKTDFAQAVAAARNSDVILCCVGENSYCETPGNISDLNLSQNQKDLVAALGATGKPVILILNEGRPRIIRDIEPVASAIVDILLPGNYGADALAMLLAGDENFSGKLPYTYPSYPNALANYDFRRAQQLPGQGGVYNYDATVQVQWFFGTGLSYTTFEYSNLKLDKTTFTADDVLTFSVDVKNSGKVAGKEAVMLFSSDLVASVSPEVRRLREFAKIDLQPGETKTVTFKVPASRLAFVGYDMKWILEEGEFRFAVGSESINANCKKTKVWKTPNI